MTVPSTATEPFNAAVYLLDRRLEAGDGERIALTGVAGDFTYAQLHDRVTRLAGSLRRLGLQPEQRIVMLMADCPDFVTVYLAAMRIGAIPVPVSTMLKADGVADLLLDSKARLLAITPEFSETATGALARVGETSGLTGMLVGGLEGALAGAMDVQGALPVHAIAELVTADPDPDVYPTTADSPAFWLYTSGTTGVPKAAMHRHGSIRVVCETYGKQVLGIRPDDRCLSAAKAFFAYGLGNTVLFPLSVGACIILEPSPSKPALVADCVQRYGATLFHGGPTFFANMLRENLPADAMAGVRAAASAGEALPASLYERWTSYFGVEILDGIGMTETLHIFLSNRPGAVRAGTTGMAVPGYQLRIVDESGHDVSPGSPGTLLVNGDSAATGYWSRYDASRQVFQGEWLRTGDTYICDADGYYSCLGRSGDMLKASGIWVSPTEVENRLLAHAAVAQAVVVSAQDLEGLEKPVAYVVLKPGAAATTDELEAFCRDGLPSIKRPRKIVFVESYPTTSTGKIRRVELREWAKTAFVDSQPNAGVTT